MNQKNPLTLLSQITGLLIGLLLVGWVLSQAPEVANWLTNPQGIAFFIGGLLICTLISFSFEELLTLFSYTLKKLGLELTSESELVETGIQLARFVRNSDAPLRKSLQESMGYIHEPFLKESMQLIVGGYTAEMIEDSLNSRAEYSLDQAKHHAKQWEQIAQYCAGTGLLGALIGLGNSSSLNTAFTSALLGLTLAYFFISPLSQKLVNTSQHEYNNLKIVSQLAQMLARGHHPLLIETAFASLRSTQATPASAPAPVPAAAQQAPQVSTAAQAPPPPAPIAKEPEPPTPAPSQFQRTLKDQYIPHTPNPAKPAPRKKLSARELGQFRPIQQHKRGEP